jgi:hypothetical protein
MWGGDESVGRPVRKPSPPCSTVPESTALSVRKAGANEKAASGKEAACKTLLWLNLKGEFGGNLERAWTTAAKKRIADTDVASSGQAKGSAAAAQRNCS